MLSMRSLSASDQMLPPLGTIENAQRKRGAALHGSSFDDSPVLQALDPSVKRYAQTKRLLTGSPFGALKCLRDFTGACPFPSKTLQGLHICCRPRTPFSVFHDEVLQRGYVFIAIRAFESHGREKLSLVQVSDQLVENRPSNASALDQETSVGASLVASVVTGLTSAKPCRSAMCFNSPFSP